MMRKALGVFVLCVCMVQSTFGYDKTELKLAYDKFFTTTQINVTDTSQLQTILENLDKKITLFLSKTKNATKTSLLMDLQSMNKAKINLLKINKIKQNVEFNLMNSTPFVSELIQKGYKNLVLDDNYEFIENNETKRFVFKQYYQVNSSNYEYFIQNKLSNAYIVRYNGMFLITNDYVIEKKYSYDELYKLFKNKVDYKNSYFIEGNDYYSYKYNYYLYFDKVPGLYLSDLTGNKIDVNTSLIIRDIDGKYLFSNDYKKIRLVSSFIVNQITNKDEFLYNILDDNKNFEGNYDKTLLDIRNTTLSLIQNQTSDDAKIFTIYKRIVNNIDYYKNFTDGNKQVYSGIFTYQNKTGVCDGYTKLFSYMLSFAGIKDVEIKRGFAFDSIDFPTFGHAWIRIGNFYYDPTFDDPIGGDNSDKSNFIYYKLPKELMYVNRFDGLTIPDTFKNMSLLQRKTLVLKNMYTLYDAYKNYPLMTKIKNRLLFGLNYDDTINMATLLQKVHFYTVNDYSYYDEIGQKYTISGLKYYLLEDSQLESILFDTNIDFKNAKFFKWYTQNGDVEYRLAYNIKYR